MMRKLLLSLFLLGCGPSTLDFPETQTIYFEKSWTPEEIEVAESSLRQWEMATNGFISAKIVPGYDQGRPFDYCKDFNRDKDTLIVYRLEESDPGLQELMYEEDSYDFWGKAVPLHTFVIRIEKVYGGKNPDRSLKLILSHEFGHLFGIYDHSKDETSTMAPALKKQQDCIDQESLDLFCDVYDCPPGFRPTCEE